MKAIFLAGYYTQQPHSAPLPEKTAPEPTPAQLSSSLIDTIKPGGGSSDRIPIRDSEGVLTIGYGLNLSKGITRAESGWILRSRLDHATHCLERNWEPYYQMPQQTQDALSNMAYQLGCSGLMGFKDMLSALGFGGSAAVAKLKALDSDWARETL